MSHRNDGPRGGITYRQCGAAAILWALTAGVCNLLGGCGTIEGVGRDIQASSRMVREWWAREQREPLQLEASIEGGDR